MVYKKIVNINLSNIIFEINPNIIEFGYQLKQLEIMR